MSQSSAVGVIRHYAWVQHVTSIVPIRRHVYDDRLRCEALSVIGYRAVCTCGARSVARGTYALARTELGALVHVPQP